MVGTIIVRDPPPPHPSRRRRRRFYAIAALSLSLTSSDLILFTLYTLETFPSVPRFGTLNLITTLLFSLSLLLILLYTLPPTNLHRRFRVPSLLPSFISTIFAIVALSWMSLTHQKLPGPIVGETVAGLLVAGWSSLLLSVITSTMFWGWSLRRGEEDTHPACSPAPSRLSQRVSAYVPRFPLPPPPTYKSPTHSRSSSLCRSVREKIVSASKATSIRSLRQHSRSPPRTPEKQPEIDHFEAWTADQSTVCDVEASLAEVAREEEWERERERRECARGLRVGTARQGEPEEAIIGAALRTASPTLPAPQMLQPTPERGRTRNLSLFPPECRSRSGSPAVW